MLLYHRFERASLHGYLGASASSVCVLGQTWALQAVNLWVYLEPHVIPIEFLQRSFDLGSHAECKVAAVYAAGTRRR